MFSFSRVFWTVVAVVASIILLGVLAVSLLSFVSDVAVAWDAWKEWIPFAREEDWAETTGPMVNDLRGPIQELGPIIDRNKMAAAELDVENQCLEQDIQQLTDSQKAAEAEMRILHDALLEDPAKKEFEFDGRAYSRQEVEADLNNRLDLYAIMQRQLEELRKSLSQGKRTLAARSLDICATERGRQALESQATVLAKEYRVLELTDRFDSDRSHLHDAADMVEKVTKRIEAMRRYSNNRSSPGAIPIELGRGKASERFEQTFNQ